MKKLVTILLILVSMGFTQSKPVRPAAGAISQTVATPVSSGGYLEVSSGADNSIVIYSSY